jgi:type VI secretion system VasD/TssJ family lipoprotein
MVLALSASTLSMAGCSTANSMLGGNTRKQALADISWDFAKDAVMIEITADPRMNQYRDESHTLLLGVYQMVDTAPFYKLIADPAALGKQLGSGKSDEGFVQFVRYVVAPGQHSILLLDRAQKAKFIGITAGYYDLNADSAARMFEVPMSVQSEGMVTSTYKAAPAVLALRLDLGADGIVNAVRLNRDPTEKQKQEAVPLDGGGKEIKLSTDDVNNAVQLNNSLKKLGK